MKFVYPHENEIQTLYMVITKTWQVLVFIGIFYNQPVVMVGSWMDFHICQFHPFSWEKNTLQRSFFRWGLICSPLLRSVMLTFRNYRWLEIPFGVCDHLEFVKKPLRLDHDSTIAEKTGEHRFTPKSMDFLSSNLQKSSSQRTSHISHYVQVKSFHHRQNKGLPGQNRPLAKGSPNPSIANSCAKRPFFGAFLGP